MGETISKIVSWIEDKWNDAWERLERIFDRFKVKIQKLVTFNSTTIIINITNTTTNETASRTISDVHQIEETVIAMSQIQRVQ